MDRWAWDERAASALATTEGRASALLHISLDTLALINDLHGQPAADAARGAAATTLTEALRTNDVAGHHGDHGGDEFLVLLPARDRQLGELIARRIHSRIRRAIIPALSTTGTPLILTPLPTSIGIAVTDPTTARPLPLPHLLHQAAAALHQAQTSGGDQILTAGTRTHPH